MTLSTVIIYFLRISYVAHTREQNLLIARFFFLSFLSRFDISYLFSSFLSCLLYVASISVSSSSSFFYSTFSCSSYSFFHSSPSFSSSLVLYPSQSFPSLLLLFSSFVASSSFSSLVPLTSLLFLFSFPSSLFS